MKKKFTLFMLLSLVSVLTSVAATSGIDFSKIQRWVGTGNNKAALAIKWADGQGDGKTLVWGYRWKDGEQPTGEMLLKAVAKADPNFYLLAKGATQYGSAIAGLGYDWNNDGEITVMDDENDSNIQYPRNGLTEAGDGYRFDHFFAGDGEDLWNAGWLSNGYWSYWVADNISSDFGYSGSGCTGRKLTDGCVDAWVFSPFSGGTNSYDGNLYYLPVVDDTKNYSEGAFVVNEDWFTHRNSAITFLSSKGNWNYKAVDNIGATACFGAFYGNKFYVIAKQEKDGNDTRTGGRITICDQGTMKVLKQIVKIDENKSNCDGRAFLGVDEHKGYVSTSSGIYILDLDQEKITGEVMLNSASIGKQCGSMVRLNNYVYTTVENLGICIIDPQTDKVVKTIEGDFGNITLSKDGSLWVVNMGPGNFGETGAGISRVDLENDKVVALELPNGIGAPQCSWGAWRPDGIYASAKSNTIYWTPGNFNLGTLAYKYDIDTKQFTKLIDLSSNSEGWQIYGASLTVDPVTEDIFVGCTKGFGNLAHENTVLKYDKQGNLLYNYELEPDVDVDNRNCWFQGMFVFPDTEDPIWNSFGNTTIKVGGSTTIDLSKYVTDADNMDAAIVKSVVSVSNDNVTATLDGDKLTIEGVKEGSTSINLKANSNGIVATTTLKVTVDAATGISNVENASDVYEVARYTIDGKRITAPQKGINIVRMSDGSTRKVVVNK